LLCSQCFREKEARESAENTAVSRLQILYNHVFDPDYNVSIDGTELSAYLRAEPLSKNGFSLDYIKFKHAISIFISSEKFEISAKGEIPRGCVIYDEGPNYC